MVHAIRVSPQARNGTERATRAICSCMRWPKLGRIGIVERAFRLLGGTIALAGLVLQFWLMTQYSTSTSIALAATHFLNFFTIQTNILLAVCMLLPAFMPGARASHVLSKPSVRTAVLSYSALTAIVYFALLRNIGEDDGLERRADQILHYVTPTMFLIDWLAWVPKGRIPFRAVPRFLIYPALYVAWTFLYGALTGWYPYPFVNAGKLGNNQLVANFVGVVVVAILIPYAFVALDRMLAGVHGQRA